MTRSAWSVLALAHAPLRRRDVYGRRAAPRRRARPGVPRRRRARGEPDASAGCSPTRRPTPTLAIWHHRASRWALKASPLQTASGEGDPLSYPRIGNVRSTARARSTRACRCPSCVPAPGGTEDPAAVAFARLQVLVAAGFYRRVRRRERTGCGGTPAQTRAPRRSVAHRLHPTPERAPGRPSGQRPIRSRGRLVRRDRQPSRRQSRSSPPPSSPADPGRRRDGDGNGQAEIPWPGTPPRRPHGRGQGTGRPWLCSRRA